MLSRQLRIFSVFGLLASVLVLAACGGAGGSTISSSSLKKIPSAAEPGTFHMGIEPWLGYGPWRIAAAQGIFSQHHLNVSITNFETDDQINSALASGRLDGANIATHTALRLAAAGLPIKIVLLEDESLRADAIIAGSGITSIKQLKGKRVAFEQGTTSDILLHHALAANGMTISDIKVVPINASDAGTAVIGGRVDAAVTYEPYISTALKQGKGFHLLYTAGEDPGLVGDVFVVRDAVINQKPGQIVALMKAWGQSVDYLSSNTANGQAIITKAVGAKPGDLTTAFAGVKIYPLVASVQQLAPGGAYLTKTINDVKQAAVQGGLIKGTVDPKSLIINQFVNAAGKQ